MNAELVPEPTPTANVYEVGDLLIDVGVRRVTRNGVDLEIAGRSFDLLLALVRAAPNLMSTQELMDGVWPTVVIGAETVTQRIMRLRQSLGDSAESPHYIVALRGHGYRMAAAVRAKAVGAPSLSPSWVEAPVSPPAAAAAAISCALPSGPPAQSIPKINRWIPVLLILTLVAGASGVWWGLERRTDGQVAASIKARPSSAAVPRSSVAVMPFANLTGDPAKGYLGDGMAEELINTLAQVPRLKVPARTSTFSYKGRDVDIRRIAQDLNVATILEGSVRSTGERLRVSARLVDAASGYQIWSQDYDRQSADIFRLQDDLAGQIVQALRTHLNVDLPTPVRAPPTQDVEAYRLFLQAVGIVKGTPSSLHLALPLIDQALTRDPNFAAALAARADFRTGLALLGGAPPGTIDDAQADAERALVLSPGLARAHSVLAMIHFVRGAWIQAEMSYEAALAADRADPGIHASYSFILLASMGRLQQAQAQASEAYHLAPADPFIETVLSGADSDLGLDAEAGRLMKLATEIGRPRLGQELLVDANAAARKGNYEEAAARAPGALPTALRDAGGGQALKLFYAALANPMKTAAARQSLQALIPQLRSETIDARISSFFVVALARLGALDAAYELANGLVANGMRLRVPTLSLNLSALWAPEMRAFRQDRRFQVLVTRLKLIDYWKQFGPPDNCELMDGKLMCH
ncbi:MAG TPA: winged helix-turn-helix domain-containing protein [Steroidobacteraceae bacterium]